MKKHYHFIGIGGIGMSGLANILLEKKCSVSGSDLLETEITQKLQQKGAKISIGHKKGSISSQSYVIYSSDIRKSNVEFQEAQEKKSSLFHRSDLLKHIMEQHQSSFVVTGTHGKTTVSSLLVWVMHQGKKPCSFSVGGIIPQLKSNGSYASQDYFVAEGDESDRSFLKYYPSGGIITNIDLDHMENYHSEEKLVESFDTFISQVKNSEQLLWCKDDQRLKKLNPKGVSYGFCKDCDIHIETYFQKGWKSYFSLKMGNKRYENIEIGLVGKHNVLNAASVFGLAMSIGIQEEDIRKGFQTFGGTLRRCCREEVNHVEVIDDYGHHPEEIKTTLEGIRQAVLERRIIVIFQPHSYSRVRLCQEGFKDCFQEADKLVVTDVYAAGEEIDENFRSQVLTEKLKPIFSSCEYVAKKDLLTWLVKEVNLFDVVVFFNAGDITYIATKFLQELKHWTKKFKVGLLYGGKSAEHEISLLSKQNIEKYFCESSIAFQSFFLSKEGKTFSSEKSRLIDEILSCDVLFPILHGPYGEDGRIQGFFETLDKPYIGPDWLSASVCMDKLFTKQILQSNHLPVVPYMAVWEKDWKRDKENIEKAIMEQFSFPFIVKPSHYGSSLGTTEVKDKKDLTLAIEEGFAYDWLLLVEKRIYGRELEFAVMGNEFIQVFPPGEILTQGEIYSYEAKYSSHSMKTTTEAVIDQKIKEQGLQIIKAAYQALGCTVMARIDCFLDKEENWYISEVNPIPGFTGISLFPMICQKQGLQGVDLMKKFIILALHRYYVRKNKI